MSNGCEIALNKTGWGACHYFIVGLCGICTFVEAIASVIVFVISRLIVCDLKLEKNDIIVFNATQSFGMAIGSFLFGSLADICGRKGIITFTMVLIFSSSIALSFAQTVFLINLFIFLLGLGLAGNYIVLRVYLIECLPIKRREICLTIIDIAWILGYLSALGVSWSLVPSIIQMLYKKFRPSSWRVLAGIGGAPSLMIACAVSLLPETPRFLLYQQRQEEAITVLRQMYAINNSKHIETYPNVDLNTCIEQDEETDDTNSLFKMIYRYCMKTYERLHKLFRLPFRRITICSLFLCFLQFPGFIWLALWDSHLLQELGKEMKDKDKGIDFTCNINFSEIAESLLLSCQQINHQRFIFLLCISFSYLLGEILLMIGIQVVRKKWILILSSFIGGIAIFCIIFLFQYAMQIIFSILFLASYAINNTIVNILIAENYPTCLRGTVMGLTRILPHLAATMIKFVSNISCVLSIIAAFIILISTAIVVIPIPDLNGIPIQERSIIQDNS
ncbi:inner membrane metabolite transport protein YgcS-like [Vespa mandarinia]|uniref:inner membrane metabolite transport protein YgcS-like n=1 Tax=Vespa mandarinia TaxID=7446 RepID=UPI001609B2C0|nr:inner membrane metabolite transport protein YgcS-like [Vespa mandarinia]